MDIDQFPQDDFMDVVEMSDNMKKYMESISSGYEKHVAISSVINSTLYFIFEKSNDLDEVVYYVNCFYEVFEDSIKRAEEFGLDKWDKIKPPSF